MGIVRNVRIFRIIRSFLLAAVLLAWALLLAVPTPARAHAVEHQISLATTVVVHFEYPGKGGKPWFERYQVFAPNTEAAFQSGYINANGEVSFRPNVPGEWRVSITTRDGHGEEVTVVVDEAGALPDAAVGAAGASHLQRIITALAWLFGAFGLVIIVRDMRRKQA